MSYKSAGKSATINRATRAALRGLDRYCRGLDDWPRSWMGLEKDLPPGEKLVACFRPFLEELVASDLSPKTIQKHVDNLWALGGFLLRACCTNETGSVRRFEYQHRRRFHGPVPDRGDGGFIMHILQ
jgi:hypothetical protein